MPVRILLADDHRIFVESLRDRIERTPGYQVVAEASGGEEAVALYSDRHPDIAVLDITMPGMNGIEAAGRIIGIDPGAGIIMLSMHADSSFVKASLKAGAKGYLVKESAFEDLMTAIDEVSSGGYFLSASINSRTLGDFAHVLRSAQEIEAQGLTPREREVLRLVAEGLSSKGIAKELGLSVKTVETHRTQIMSRLGLHSIADLTKYAIREGLTTLEP